MHNRSLVLHASKETYRSGEAIEVAIETKNLLNENLTDIRSPGGHSSRLSFKITGPDGREVETKPVPCGTPANCEVSQIFMGSQVFKTIPRGGSIQETVNLSETYDLSTPGTYTVVAYEGLRQGVHLSSPPLKIVITAP